MKYKTISVFFDENGNPFKDVAREVPCSIINGAFIGASNTTKVYFYYDKLLNEDDDPATWVAVSKLPNGKIGSKVLESYLDEEINEHYALLELDSFYTQYKGDVYLALQGYQGGVQVLEDSETGIYTIVGTPTIQTTGNVRLNILYAPQFIGSDETENVNFQQILADLSTKLGIRTQTILVNELPTTGETNVFYVIENDSENPNKANIYIWNGTTQSYVWVGDNTLFLGDYYTAEQATTFENGIKTRVSAVENELSSVASGSPAGVYATLSDLTTADPSHDRIYVVTATGNWYYWGGTQWASGGTYQTALGIDDDFDNESENPVQNKVISTKLINIVKSINLFDPSKTTNEKYIATDGELYNYSQTGVSDYIPIKAGDVIRYNYCIYTGQTQQGALYDTNKQLISNVSHNSTNSPVEVTASADGFIRINFTLANISTGVMLIINNSWTSFVPYYKKYYLNNDVLISEEKAKEIFDENLSSPQIINVFNRINETQNKLINYTGTISNANNYYLSDFLPIDYGTIYYTPKSASYTKEYVICLFKEDKESVVSLSLNNIEEETLGNIVVWKITIPNIEDIKYARFTYYYDQVDTKMVLSGLTTTYPTTKIPYNYYDRYLPNYIKFNETQIEEIKLLASNNLLNKSMACCGDSIMESRIGGATDNGGGWAKMVADNNNMTLNNIALSGSRLSDYYENGSLVATKTIYKQLETLSDTYDFLCFDGGINDFAVGKTMGTITTTYLDGSSNYDTDTVIGGLEALCSRLVFHHQTAKWLFVFNHRIYPDSELSNGQTYAQFVIKVKQVLEKWGVPYIDLQVQVPPINLLGTTFKNTYTNNGDGWHPNALGYKTFYVDKIEAKLKEL